MKMFSYLLTYLLCCRTRMSEQSVPWRESDVFAFSRRVGEKVFADAKDLIFSSWYREQLADWWSLRYVNCDSIGR